MLKQKDSFIRDLFDKNNEWKSINEGQYIESDLSGFIIEVWSDVIFNLTEDESSANKIRLKTNKIFNDVFKNLINIYHHIIDCFINFRFI